LREAEQDMDLIETVRIYEAYVSEYIQSNSEMYSKSPTIQMAITGIQSTLHDIHQILQGIDAKIKAHEKRWRISVLLWGPPTFAIEIRQLNAKKNILTNRFQMFATICGQQSRLSMNSIHL
jgi:hypothetical protein